MTLKNAAPVEKSSGAPVAQTDCATGGFPPRVNPAAQRRATAASPVAQQQQAGVSPHGEIRRTGADKCSKNRSKGMKISEVAVDRVHDALALADVILAEIDEDSDKCTPPMSHEAWVRNRIGIAKMLIDAEAQP